MLCSLLIVLLKVLFIFLQLYYYGVDSLYVHLFMLFHILKLTL